jgi:hypothetical protein
MAVVAANIDTFLTGEASNADPNLSLGGVKSSVEWAGGTLHDLFDVMSAVENAANDDEYRAIAVQNSHATQTAYAFSVYVSDQVAGGADFALAVADEAKNTTVETIADENTPPTGPAFSAPTTAETALLLGDLGPGEWRGLWIRRTGANSAAKSNDGGEITFTWETEE